MQPLTIRDPDTSLVSSARGWHGIQLAVLGFIGLCGVLRGGSDGGSGPAWVKWGASGAAVLALFVACRATYQVGRIAFPLRNGGPADAGRLRSGIRQTYLAVGLIATAAMTAWWPAAVGGTGRDAGGTVVVRTADGRTWCGELVDLPTDLVRIRTGGGLVTLPLSKVTVTPGDC